MDCPDSQVECETYTLMQVDLAALRAECERLKVEGLRLMAIGDDLRTRIAELTGELGLMLEYFERGVPYWYGISPVDRIRAVLKKDEALAGAEAALRAEIEKAPPTPGDYRAKVLEAAFTYARIAVEVAPNRATPETWAALDKLTQATYNSGWEAALADTLGMLEEIAKKGDDVVWRGLQVRYIAETEKFIYFRPVDNLVNLVYLTRDEAQAALLVGKEKKG